MEKETIKLEYPVEVDGVKYDELFMRRPKVRDNLAARRSKGGDEDKEIKLLSNLCEVSPTVIEALDIADYMALQEVFAGFLPSRRS